MKFAASNIAWQPENRVDAYAILADHGFTGLEIAPGLLFHDAADPFAPDETEQIAALAPVRAAGLQLVSMQSLLFGVEGAELFGDEDAHAAFVTGMERAIALGGMVGIPNLVFGSPRQRVIPDTMAREDAEALACETFRKLGEKAAAAGLVIAMECNPADYGTNFLTKPDEVAAFVRRVDHPAVTINLDIGAVHMNGLFDEVEQIVGEALPRASHVHVSEPQLAPAPADEGQARRVLKALRVGGYSGWVSIEMRSAGIDALRASVARLAAAREAA